MRKLGSFLRLLGFFIILTPLNSSASMRCSSGLVSVGDTLSEVVEKCGSPDFKREVKIGNDSSNNPRLRSVVVVLFYYGPRNGSVSQVRFSGDNVANIITYRPMGSGDTKDVYPQNP
ncbi:DUF2845 domain-containing protein [Pseudomonas psychrotolerans]|uniref:DUF2845 domain-containing protein n=2 Tax=Pseudomonas oryzihabitans TaxID=47885 RepID=UPI0015E27A2A|nr:DUF2845 domain-containing protein [Pseudomonas psychrotolerans]MBA1211157.1 DUF2845 domain-containing protein [Pseudomonas psychrotolerans]